MSRTTRTTRAHASVVVLGAGPYGLSTTLAFLVSASAPRIHAAAPTRREGEGR